MQGWSKGLFDGLNAASPGRRIELAEGAHLLPGFALEDGARLVEFIDAAASEAPFRRMTTPGGKEMSAAMTSCGQAGWITDESGYRYSERDPMTRRPWPALPQDVQALARAAAAEAGFPDFPSEACVINRYEPGARMSLHQDRDEQNLRQPIVSISLGLPAVFLLGGLRRQDKTQRRRLEHGDVVVWGGSSRLRFHGVLPIEPGKHPVTGALRYNLTFRAVRLF